MSMDIPHLVIGASSLIIGIFIFLIISFLFRKSSNIIGEKKKNQQLNYDNNNNLILPKVPGAWPVIGHLHHLKDNSKPTHLILANMADKYGPIFTLNLGVHRTLFVHDVNTAKECLTTHDKVFATRPKTSAGEVLGYNYAMFGIGPYGPYWRQYRKVVMVQLLSHRRLEMLGHVRESELKSSIKDIYQFWRGRKNVSSDDQEKVMVMKEMKEWFSNFALNVSARILFGIRYSSNDQEGEKAFNLLRELLQLIGNISISDAIPYLKWLDLDGHMKSMKKTGKKVDDMLQIWLEEHKKRRNKKLGEEEEEEEEEEDDFMAAMLAILDGASSEDLCNYTADNINKATCLGLFLGATDTTTVTLIWALSLLLNHPKDLKKVMDELDEQVGKQRTVQELDIKNLVYLQAVIKETLRLYPPAPMGLPHESMEECHVAGYRVPKGTRLVLNLHSIQRDPNAWSDPDEFRPERFLTTHKDVDVRGQHFELIPFGSGRRICPGISFGLNIVQFVLASFLQSFEVCKPYGNKPIDMTNGLGQNNLKATPLEVLLSPRLSADLYD